MGSRAERTHCKAAAGGPGEVAAGRGQSHISVWITGRNNCGVRQTAQPQGSSMGNKASKPLAENTCGHCSGGRNSQLHGRVHGRDPQNPRPYTNPPTQFACGQRRESLRASRELSRRHCSLSDHPPRTVPQCSYSHVGCPTLVST